MIPSLLPLYDFEQDKLGDGAAMQACSFCKNSIKKKPECWQHYDGLRKQPEGYYQCPFGFTTRTFYFSSKLFAITGVIAHPRFNTESERALAKQYPEIKTSRAEIEQIRNFFSEIDLLRASEVQKGAAIFPQAFHELRKLNGTIIQSAEIELRSNPDDRFLKNIQAAAELMRNNFDILEALSNIEGMKAVPLDATVNVFDLVYKMKHIYLDRANVRGIQIWVGGKRIIVKGNRKTFPIVPAVLLENAIKYGEANSTINASVEASDKTMIFTVENRSAYSIDPNTCFARGTRFAGQSVEGGGFGLFLAKEIVLAHQGTISCTTDGTKISMVVQIPLWDIMDD